MKKAHAIPGILLLWATAAWAAGPGPLDRLSAVARLTNAEASRGLKATFTATVTYFRGYEYTLVVQDGDASMYIRTATKLALVPGDRILVRGTTHGSFRPYVSSDDITLISYGSPPPAVAASFDEIVKGDLDCRRVTVRGLVTTADTTLSTNVPSSRLELRMEGGNARVTINRVDPAQLTRLLDSEVEVTGITSGVWDGKMQMTGVAVLATSFEDVKVLRRAQQDPWSAPETPMDQILRVYHVADQTARVRVTGTVTYYQPGEAAVLQSGARSVWVTTDSRNDLKVGDVAEVIGFPGIRNGFLALIRAEVRDTGKRAPITPQPASWNGLSQSQSIFDLVSITGRVVMEVEEPGQDEYVLDSDGRLFSAIMRHNSASRTGAMRQLPLGSTVRVTGICIPEDSNPFGAQVPFNILMRSGEDMEELAQASWLTVKHLSWMLGAMLGLILAIAGWGWSLRRRVQQQTAVIAAKAETETALERRRSQILEDINAGRPLQEILSQVTELVSMNLRGACCRCLTDDNDRAGWPAGEGELRLVERELRGRSGQVHGKLVAGFDPKAVELANESVVLSMGAWLATLAIETQGLYADLRHRSEFDLLTDLRNRFSFEVQLDVLIEAARLEGGSLAVVYLDLDDFKEVNDTYGHHIGDLYLQQAAQRMRNELRADDTLARIGGDEFCALVSLEPCKVDASELVSRLRNCFIDAFVLDGQRLRGTASAGVAIFPQDGNSRESLLIAADAAMYVAKNEKNLKQGYHEVEKASTEDYSPVRRTLR